MPIAAQVQRSISDQERPRADSEQMMSALGLDPDLYKVITVTMMKAFAIKYNRQHLSILGESAPTHAYFHEKF